MFFQKKDKLPKPTGPSLKPWLWNQHWNSTSPLFYNEGMWENVMKKLIVMMMCLSLSLQGYAVEVSRAPSSYRLEQGTFSSLFIKPAQFAELSKADRTVYFMSILSLMQIIEISQSRVMKKVNSPTHSARTKAELLHKWYELWFEKAYAGIADDIQKHYFQALASVTSRIAGVGNAVQVYFNTTSASATESAAKLEINTLNAQAVKARAESERASAANEAIAIRAAKEDAFASIKAWVAAEKAFKKTSQVSAADSDTYKNSKKNLDDASEKVSTRVNRLITASPSKKEESKKQLADMMAKSGMAKVNLPIKDADGKTAGDAAAMDFLNFVEKAANTSGLGQPVVAQAASNTEVSVAGAAKTPKGKAAATAAAAADEKSEDQEAGGACLFGGRPSVWKDQGGTINCTRPKGSACGAGNFQCQTYGLQTEKGPIDSDLCISLMPLDDLTIRCSRELKKVVNNKTANRETDAFNKAYEELYELVKDIEESPQMKDEDGQTQTIGGYCKKGPPNQMAECAAMMEVVAAIRSTKAGTIIAANQETEKANAVEVPANPAGPAIPAASAIPANPAKPAASSAPAPAVAPAAAAK
jgi:hypothetical protein